MIILDIETTGLDPARNCIASIGAVDWNSGAEFYRECRIFMGAAISPEALKVNGFTEEQLNDKTKQDPHVLYGSFVSWCHQIPNQDFLLAGQQVGSFDVLFLKHLHNLFYANDKWIFGHRTLDLHSVAYAKFGKSLSLDGIFTELGLEPEPKPHHALVGAKLEREALKLLLK